MKTWEGKWWSSLLILLGFLIPLSGYSDEPKLPEIDLVAARQQVLDALANLPESTLKLENLDQATPEARALAEFYRDRIWPVQRKKYRLVAIEGLYTVALDRGLARDETEYGVWEQAKNEASVASKALGTDPAWHEAVARFGQLAAGQTGELADYARILHQDLIIGEFATDQQPLLAELTGLETQIKKIANLAPLAKGLPDVAKASADILTQFYAGQLPFDQAWQEIEKLTPRGQVALGQYVSEHAASQLNRAAVLRTKLAKSKGYRNWAEYQLATQARTYAPGLQTTLEKKAFLEKILSDSADSSQAFRQVRLGELAPGMPVSELRPSQRALLPLQTETLLRPYFPREKIEAIWRETMIESGFSPALVDSVHLDGYPRGGKYSSAYMSNVTDHAPKQYRIDAQTLQFLIPPDSSEDWFAALIYIVQNYMDDGIDGISTAFHEGGHFFHLIQELNYLGLESPYAYTEVHSTLMEYFLTDRSFLKKFGRTREGVLLSERPELIEEYLQNLAVNELALFRAQTAQAWYDIELWDYDYDQGNVDFVTRARNVWGETLKKLNGATLPVIDGIDLRNAPFATSHFYSGNVRYFGYIGASVATHLVWQSLMKHLEQKTSRAEMVNQPGLAAFLLPLYQTGFRQPFPASIEGFTGQRFSSGGYLNALALGVDGYCARALKKKN